MTEELETGDFEYSSENDALEEEVDKLNDLTFGDELSWKYDKLNFENDDSNFERFPFDEIESNADEEEISFKDQNENDRDNLLGLKGSFFNFGLFKSSQQGDSEISLNNNKDADFKLAMGKLDLIDVDEEKEDSTSGLGFGDYIISPKLELIQFSELLHIQFKETQRTCNNAEVLRNVANKHLDMLSKKISQLSLSVDNLAQLRYYYLLTLFVTADNRFNEVRIKCGTDPRLYSAHLAVLVQQFLSQSPQQQLDLSSIHPFYNGLMLHLCSQKNIAPINQNDGYPLEEEFDPNKGGWMSASERDWLIKMQTRNLVSDNPYVHDYYYTIVTFHRMSAARQNQLLATGHTTIADPISLLPSPITADQIGSGVDPTKDGITPQYVPVQYPNALGTVTTWNLNTPRKTIDLPVRQKRVVSTKNDLYRTVRDHRELLGSIESLHSIVLRVDEIDKSLTKMLVVQHPSRGILIQYRVRLIRSLISLVAGSELGRLLSVAKGAAVLISVISLLDPSQFVDFLVLQFNQAQSIFESRFFGEVESRWRPLIQSRIRALSKDHLSRVLTAFFRDIGSTTSDTHTLPLAVFCRNQFGQRIVFTVLDAFFKLSPEDKFNIKELILFTLKCSCSATTPQHIIQDCPALFSAITIDLK